MASCEAAARQVRLLLSIQIALAAIAAAALMAIVAIKFLGRGGDLVIPLGVAMIVCGAGMSMAGRKAKPFNDKFEMIKRAVAQRQVQAGGNPDESVTGHAGHHSAEKIPLTLGFANLSGGDLDAMVSEDAAALSPLFSNSRLVSEGQIPSADVLFVYAHLNEDGTFQGLPSSGIRQLVQLTNAAIVVLASPNPPVAIQHAIGLPGPKTANLVFTLDRSGDGFGRFFRSLFEKMRGGKDMPNAWVELAPQHRGANLPDTPQTIFLAEAGKIAFPAAVR